MNLKLRLRLDFKHRQTYIHTPWNTIAPVLIKQFSIYCPPSWNRQKRWLNSRRCSENSGLFDTLEAERIFRENLKCSAELGIGASPTILVDNRI